MPTRRKLRFHDTRSTGLTWLAVRGDNPHQIQQRAGHRATPLSVGQMTQKYIRTAEELQAGFGEPFPVLPLAVVSPKTFARK
jgi:hypothetical protein